MRFKPILTGGVILSVGLGIAAPAAAQDNQIHLPPLISQGPGSNRVPVVTETEQDKARVYKMAVERQELIRRDTDKLAELTAELKEYVDKSDTNILSPEMVKKAATIEKLAKSVQNKMNER